MGPSVSSTIGRETLIVLAVGLELTCLKSMSELKEGAKKNDKYHVCIPMSSVYSYHWQLMKHRSLKSTVFVILSQYIYTPPAVVVILYW